MGEVYKALRGLGALVLLLAGVEGVAGTPRPEVNFAMNLNFVVFDDSGWTPGQIQDQVREAQNTYAQCGAKFSHIQFFYAHATNGSDNLVRTDASSAKSFIRLAEEVRGLPRPLVFLIKSISNVDSKDSAFSRAAFIGGVPEDYPDAILDTVWLPAVINSPGYSGRSRYSTLAHEITHILTLDPEHNGNGTEFIRETPNLMTVAPFRTNFIPPKMCHEIVTSRFMYPILGPILAANMGG